MRTSVGGWLRRLTSDESELEADTLCSEVDANGATRAGTCHAGQRVEIMGKLRCVQLQPSEALATLVAELYDGTDTVQLIWLGRRTIAGIEAGRTLRAKGRIAVRDGHKVMYNPSYQLLPASA
jgi:hypothetical protein